MARKKKYLFRDDPKYLLMATTGMNLESVKEIFKRMLYLKDLNGVYFVKDDEGGYWKTYLTETGKAIPYIVAPHTKWRYGIYGKKVLGDAILE